MNKSMQLSTYFKEIITFSNVMAMKTKLLIQGIQLLFRSIVSTHFSIYCQESFGLMIWSSLLWNLYNATLLMQLDIQACLNTHFGALRQMLSLRFTLMQGTFISI